MVLLLTILCTQLSLSERDHAVRNFFFSAISSLRFYSKWRLRSWVWPWQHGSISWRRNQSLGEANSRRKVPGLSLKNHLNRKHRMYIWIWYLWIYGSMEFNRFLALCASKVTSFCGFLVAFASILVLVAKVTWWQMGFTGLGCCQNPAAKQKLLVFFSCIFWRVDSSGILVGKSCKQRRGQHWLYITCKEF